MLSPFTLNEKILSLFRYPLLQVNRSLQAWDAADEFIVNHVRDEKLITDKSNILIFNDNFGALTCSFSQHTLYCVNDSLVSQLGIEHNLKHNQLINDKSNITLLSSLDALPNDIDIILYKIPKSKSLLTHQLLEIKKNYQNATITFIAADRAKDIHSSTLKLFEKYLGETKTSLAVKKARLVFSSLDNAQRFDTPFPTQWPLENTTFTINNYANVYSREKLDIGARNFIKNLPVVPPHAKVIDLGCGNGVIGLSVLAAQPDISITLVDESHMAIKSAQDNICTNLPNAASNCEFLLNDCLSGVPSDSVDLILCNPPFHQQNATTDHIAWSMFKDSFRVLKKGGELRIIGNRQLGYHVKLKRIFGNEKLIASNEKFVTLSSIK